MFGEVYRVPLKSASVAIVKETVRAQLLKQEQAVKKESSKKRKAMAAQLAEANEDGTQERKEELEALAAALEEAALSDEETTAKGKKRKADAADRKSELATRKAQEKADKEARKRADLSLRLAATALQKLSPLQPRLEAALQLLQKAQGPAEQLRLLLTARDTCHAWLSLAAQRAGGNAAVTLPFAAASVQEAARAWGRRVSQARAASKQGGSEAKPKKGPHKKAAKGGA